MQTNIAWMHVTCQKALLLLNDADKQFAMLLGILQPLGSLPESAITSGNTQRFTLLRSDKLCLIQYDVNLMALHSVKHNLSLSNRVNLW